MVSSRTRSEPIDVPRNESRTESQNACGSCSPRPTDTHATRSPRPSAAIHERNRNVFPLPAGAETSTTRSAPVSSSNRPGRGINHDLIPEAAGSTANPE